MIFMTGRAPGHPSNLVILFGHQGSLCNMMLQVVPWALIANEFQFERTERINTKHCRIFCTLYKGCVDCEFFVNDTQKIKQKKTTDYPLKIDVWFR